MIMTATVNATTMITTTLMIIVIIIIIMVILFVTGFIYLNNVEMALWCCG